MYAGCVTSLNYMSRRVTYVILYVYAVIIYAWLIYIHNNVIQHQRNGPNKNDIPVSNLLNAIVWKGFTILYYPKYAQTAHVSSAIFYDEYYNIVSV